jgi:hypothetical protein
VYEARDRSRQPFLRGMELNSETVESLDRIVAIIEQNSNPDEPIFAYPFMPIFYYLTGRPTPTFGYVDYHDVCPDKYAREDAERLLKNPPAVIIETVFPEKAVEFGERVFRGGMAAGQRDLEEAIRKITANYKLAAKLEGNSYSYGDGSYPIRVWVRPRSEHAPVAQLPASP